MEKIIGQKRYNTSTAEKIVTTPAGILYRKRNGELFIEQGGKLIPMTRDMALIWVEQNCPQVKKALFAERPLPKTATFSLTPETWHMLDEIADRTGIKKSEIVRVLIEQEYRHPRL